MNSQKTDIALRFVLDGANLPVGESSPHEVCPVCNGGSTGERSFIIRRISNDLISFRCYRNSCRTRGSISVSSGSLVPSSSETTKRSVTYSTGGFDLLTDEQCRIVEKKCNTNRLGLLATGVKVDALTRRIMFPLYDADNELKGYQLRYYDGISTGNTKPKALTHWFDDTARLALTTPRRNTTEYSDTIIIVEDWPSALRVSRAGFPSAAILGTSLSIDSLSPLALAGYQKVLLCLDADAKSTALRHKLTFSSMFRNFSVKLLSNLDIKDMNAEDFHSFIQEVKQIYE